MRNEELSAPRFFELVYRLVQLLGLFSRLFNLLAAPLDILSGTLYGIARAHRERQRYGRCDNFEQIQNSHGVSPTWFYEWGMGRPSFPLQQACQRRMRTCIPYERDFESISRTAHQRRGSGTGKGDVYCCQHGVSERTVSGRELPYAALGAVLHF